MYAVEKKTDIEMKLKKEMSNIAELQAAAARSSALSTSVCGVLGACERRLQLLETAVLPLYGDTARLQQIHENMEGTVKSLEQVIDYYMVARQQAELIQAGPHTSTPEKLTVYLEALDKLSEAQKYFNKHMPQSVELENINQLFNAGVTRLEAAFSDLLAKATRPLSPTALADMMQLDEDSSADSISISSSTTTSTECLRLAAAWLSGAARPPLQALTAARAPAAAAAAAAARAYIQAGLADGAKTKTLLNRSDSAKKTNKIQKVLEKRANKIMQRASATLESSTGLALGSRRAGAADATCEADAGAEAALLAAAAARLSRAEQRFLLGLVPLPHLGALLAAVTRDCYALLAADVERACARFKRESLRCRAAGAGGWALLARLARLAAESHAAPHARPLAAMCQEACVASLEAWLRGVRGVEPAAAADGTVHRVAADALHTLAQLADHAATLGPVLAQDPAYARAAALAPPAADRDAVMLAVYMRKLLAQLNLALRSLSEAYPEALKAIFLLNNTLFLLQGLQRGGLLEVLALAEPECEASYRDLIQEYKNNYLQSWSRLQQLCALDEPPPPPGRLRDKDRQMLKDKFSSFNREFEEATRAGRGYAVPDAELRDALHRENKAAVLPAYARLHAAAAAAPFSKTPEKYVKYSPEQIAAQLDGYFDEAA